MDSELSGNDMLNQFLAMDLAERVQFVNSLTPEAETYLRCLLILNKGRLTNYEEMENRNG